MVEVVVPGVFWIGALYVSVRLLLVNEGTWAVDVFAVEIWLLADITQGDVEPNLAI